MDVADLLNQGKLLTIYFHTRCHVPLQGMVLHLMHLEQQQTLASLTRLHVHVLHVPHVAHVLHACTSDSWVTWSDDQLKSSLFQRPNSSEFNDPSWPNYLTQVGLVIGPIQPNHRPIRSLPISLPNHSSFTMKLKSKFNTNRYPIFLWTMFENVE